MKDHPVLTQRQRTVLRLFVSEKDLAATYVLGGGTALAAYYLRHRQSDDLDFFTKEEVDRPRVERFIALLKRELDARDVQAKKLYDRRIFTLLFADGDELKTEFTQFPFGRLEKPMRQDGVLIESLRDIAAGKLAAMLDRCEAKDYVDLYFLLKEKTDIRTVWNDAQKKFGILHGPMQIGSALMRARNLAVLPKMIKPVTREEIATFLEEVARGLRSDIVAE